jgi:hypothetical protein
MAICAQSTPARRRGVLSHSMAAFFATAAVAVAFASFLAHRASGADSDTKTDKPPAAHDKYSVKVPGGLRFSEFRGYEKWQAVSISENGKFVALILGNPIMIEALKAGIPDNGKPFPDGAKLAKVHWLPKQRELFPAAKVPGSLDDVDFMVKDSKRFADSSGWGYGAFDYDKGTDSFTPATTTDQPPQGSDAKCGAACHTIAKGRDYVFTEYAER